VSFTAVLRFAFVRPNIADFFEHLLARLTDGVRSKIAKAAAPSSRFHLTHDAPAHDARE
jgi:hypothetical protein